MATGEDITTQVANMGARPARLMRSLSLAKGSIDSAVIEVPSHKEHVRNRQCGHP